MKINYKYKKAAMAIFMIVLISFGGIRAYEKMNVLDDETPTLNGNYSQLAAYPTSDMFKWNVVKINSENTSYIVSEYDTWTKQELNIKMYSTPSVENGNYSSALSSIKIADTLPEVKKFKWNSYYTLVNANYNSNKWDITYYDILTSYTANNVTVTVP